MTNIPVEISIAIYIAVVVTVVGTAWWLLFRYGRCKALEKAERGCSYSVTHYPAGGGHETWDSIDAEPSTYHGTCSFVANGKKIRLGGSFKVEQR